MNNTYDLDEEILYGIDFLSDYFKSETILLKLFENAVYHHHYDSLDIIVHAIYRYLCDIIDSADSFSIFSNRSEDMDLYHSFKKDEFHHFVLDSKSKIRMKKLIRFNLSYDRENSVVFPEYDSKYLSKDKDNSIVYLFYLNHKTIVEFHSNVCLFFDYRPYSIIWEHQQKYRDIIDFNLFAEE